MDQNVRIQIKVKTKNAQLIINQMDMTRFVKREIYKPFLKLKT